ncbi:MAG TPA: HAMP domain-containing sensor histidine kinase [Mycobacteriales bacterium]|nr:HAMP domain-containing sensor histidine kinase [Mycobacteriales bacterium]
MTRRLAAALGLFTIVVLAASVVPLGVATAERDRHDFERRTADVASAVAALLDDAHDSGTPPPSALRLEAAAGAGAGVLVYDGAGRLSTVAGAHVPVPPKDFVAAALRGEAPTGWFGDDPRFAVAGAALTEAGDTHGAIVVGRSAAVVEERVQRLWTGLAALAAIVLVLAALLAVLFAGWVGRPLRRLEVAAQEWAEGHLDGRTDAESGPPEVRELARAFNAMAARLEALVHGSRAVVADVSHQLRTPLAAVRLRLDLLRDEVDPAGLEDLTAAATEIDRLSRLVDGLLAVARAEHADSVRQPVALGPLLEERRYAWQPVADERGVTVEAAGQPATALVTPGTVEQVLDNLIANALDAVRPRGRVRLECFRQGDRVVIRVVDDGPGMPKEQRDVVFRRFVGGSPGRGSGLGLAIVHRLVTSDGGTVDLSAAPDGGTVVTVELPRSAQPGG